MKELSIEEKARNYDEAYKRVAVRFGSNVAGEIFPELKESEDERIMENIIATIHLYYGEPLEDEAKEMVAWLEKQGGHANFINKIQIGDKVTRNEDGVLVNLSQLKRVAKRDEKQGEQKPAEWSEEDEEIYRKCICAMRASACGFPEEEKFVEQVDNWLKSLKDRVQPKPMKGLSEEDESIVTELIGIFESAIDGGHVSFPYRLIKDYIRVLKSCLSQNTWKPSDEQMEALESATENCAYSEYQGCLRELIEQLKKLKG